MTTLLVVSADHHINSTVALAPPDIELDDGGTYYASESQKYLWRCWQDAWATVEKLKEKEKPEKTILVLNGDLTELDTKRRSNQIVTPNKATILDMVHAVLEKPSEIADQLYVIRGTAAHTGKSSWSEEAIAQDYDSNFVVRPTKKGQASWWHLRSQVEGLRIDISHHGNFSSIPWNVNNAALALSQKIKWQYAFELQSDLPHLVVRSHVHKAVSVNTRNSPHVCFTPCWSMITEYGYRAGLENSLPDIGLVAFVIDGDRYVQHDISYKHPLAGSRKVWAHHM